MARSCQYLQGSVAMKWTKSVWVCGLGLTFGMAGCGGAGTSNAYSPPNFNANSPAGSREGSPLPKLSPVVTGEPMADTPVAVSLWEDSKSPEKSRLVVAERKADHGALNLFDFQGKNLGHLDVKASIRSLDSRTSCHFGDQVLSLAVTASADDKLIHFYTWQEKPAGWKELDHSDLKISQFEKKEVGVLAVAIYKRASDGAVFLFASPTAGPQEDHLLGYRLGYADGKISLKELPRFGRFSGRTPTGEGSISSLVADDATGELFAWDERAALRRINIDSSKKDPFKETGQYARDFAKGGKAAITFSKDKVVVSKATVDSSSLGFYDREGKHQLTNSGSLPIQTATSMILFPKFMTDQMPSGGIVTLDSVARTLAIFDIRSLSLPSTTLPAPVAPTPPIKPTTVTPPPHPTP